MSLSGNHLYEESHLEPVQVSEINVLTQKARMRPPSGDQTHVLIEDGEDPWVINYQDRLFYCSVDRTKQHILVAEFDELQNMAHANLVSIWPKENEKIPEYKEIWAPELQFIDGKWYVYFSLYLGDGKERIWVLEGLSDDPQGEYSNKGSLQIPTDRWAIDGSVLETENKEKYFIWSGWDDYKNTSQNIYIAKMSNPYTITSDRYCISKPEHGWEKHGYPYVNEGPQALQRDGKIFIIYSASGSWTDEYCLGQLTYLGGDMLDANSWRKEPMPVFSKTETIFGPGHASFINFRNQDYIIYHAARCSQAGWARQIRAKAYTWKEDGTPNFGKPL
jgi:GH43 family beta-xylosidase